MLLLLLAACVVSIILGVITDPEHGYVEGVAIFIAVFLVAIITAVNDYSKELQFRALERFASKIVTFYFIFITLVNSAFSRNFHFILKLYFRYVQGITER